MISDVEPMHDDDQKRYTLFHIQYPDVWGMYKKVEASFWKVEEVDLSSDLEEELQTVFNHVDIIFAENA